MPAFLTYCCDLLRNGARELYQSKKHTHTHTQTEGVRIWVRIHWRMFAASVRLHLRACSPACAHVLIPLHNMPTHTHTVCALPPGDARSAIYSWFGLELVEAILLSSAYRETKGVARLLTLPDANTTSCLISNLVEMFTSQAQHVRVPTWRVI